MTVKTPHLRGRGDICLYVPALEQAQDLPIYLLLHGVYGSAWVWAFKGGAHLTAQRLMEAGQIKPAIVAFPSDGLWGDGSAYFPHHEKRFDQWIIKDVPLAIREQIPQASSRSSLCIGGLSMGGYGALLLGGRYPDTFSAISGHSSITALKHLESFVEEPLSHYTEAFEGKDVLDTLIHNKPSLPPIRFDCGIDDNLIQANRDLHAALLAHGISHVYQEFQGGHEWAYWHKHVEKTFRFFDTVLYPPKDGSEM